METEMENAQPNKAEWNQFVLDHAPESGAFLHSWSWGEFQQATGKTIHRKMDKKGVALLIENRLPFGKSFLYCPRGPLGEMDLAEFGKEYGSLFVRYDAVKERKGKKVKDIQPADTLILDLDRDEKELLARMHHKTRYNIRLAEKKEIEVKIGSTVSFDEVWSIFEMTGKRGNFGLHSRGYYEKMLEVLDEDDCQAFLAVARHKGEVLAATIMIDSGETRTYLHGASSNEKRELMAPHLLHWELIKDAKKKGKMHYDWWGIAPEGAKDHPWAGVTRFKKGFGGRTVRYPGTFEIPFNGFWYRLYRLAKRFR